MNGLAIVSQAFRLHSGRRARSTAMTPSNSWTSSLSLAIIAVLFFGVGWSMQMSGNSITRGLVAEIVALERVPVYVNRWCLSRGDNISRGEAGVAIVRFGEGRRAHLYAYPQTPSVVLAVDDRVWSDLSTCSLAKVTDPGPVAGSMAAYR